MGPSDRAPIEHKVAVGTLSAVMMLAILWGVITFAFPHAAHSLTALIPGFGAVVTGFAASYLAKHTPRLDEVLTVVLDQLGTRGHEMNTAGSALRDRIDGTPSVSAASLGVVQEDPYESLTGLFDGIPQ